MYCKLGYLQTLLTIPSHNHSVSSLCRPDTVRRFSRHATRLNLITDLLNQTWTLLPDGQFLLGQALELLDLKKPLDNEKKIQDLSWHVSRVKRLSYTNVCKCQIDHVISNIPSTEHTHSQNNVFMLHSTYVHITTLCFTCTNALQLYNIKLPQQASPLRLFQRRDLPLWKTLRSNDHHGSIYLFHWLCSTGHAF